MKRALLLLSAISLVLPVAAQNKKQKKSNLPMAVVAAQYVYITSMHGDSFNPNTSQEDRDALYRVEDAIRAWGKYHIVYHPEEATLMLVVKPGYIVDTRTGISLGGPPMDPNRPAAKIGVGHIPVDNPHGPASNPPPDQRVDPQVGGTITDVDVANNPNDMLFVSLSPHEPAMEADFIWRRSARHGLRGSKPALVEAFRDAVDAAARQNAKP